MFSSRRAWPLEDHLGARVGQRALRQLERLLLERLVLRALVGELLLHARAHLVERQPGEDAVQVVVDALELVER